MWDVLFDVASGQVVVHKDIHINHPPPTTTHSIGAPPLIITRSGTLKAEFATATDEEMGRIPTKDSQKPDATARADSDNLFIEDVSPSSVLIHVRSPFLILSSNIDSFRYRVPLR